MISNSYRENPKANFNDLIKKSYSFIENRPIKLKVITRRSEVNSFKEQLLLINCCLSKKQETLATWEECKKIYDFEKISASLDYSVKRILPTLYSIISEVENNSKILEKLNYYSNKTKEINTNLLNLTEEILLELNKNNIDAMLLKGISLVVQKPELVNIRAMCDIDIMVKEKDFKQTTEILKSLGYYFSISMPHADDYLNNENVKIDLHQMIGAFIPNDNDIFWENAIEVKIGSSSAKVMSMTKQFFYICLHANNLRMRSLYWVNDLINIYKLSNEQIDWDEFLELVIKYNVRAYIAEPIRLLKENNYIDIPDKIIECVREENFTYLERLEIYMDTLALENPFRIIFGRIIYYLRLRKDKRFSKPIVGIFKFFECWPSGKIDLFLPFRIVYKVITYFCKWSKKFF